MSTTIRPEISSSNKYWISRHRYYELKHFCLQYPEWKKQYNAEKEAWRKKIFPEIHKDSTYGDPTMFKAMTLYELDSKITLVEKAAIEADRELASYILKAVTEGRSFAYLKSRLEMPCERDMYYDRYRRFFYILSNLRN